MHGTCAHFLASDRRLDAGARSKSNCQMLCSVVATREAGYFYPLLGEHKVCADVQAKQQKTTVSAARNFVHPLVALRSIRTILAGGRLSAKSEL
jgi:hypothetical protein